MPPHELGLPPLRAAGPPPLAAALATALATALAAAALGGAAVPVGTKSGPLPKRAFNEAAGREHEVRGLIRESLLTGSCPVAGGAL